MSDGEVSLEASNTRLEFMDGVRNFRPKQVIRINADRLRATEKILSRNILNWMHADLNLRFVCLFQTIFEIGATSKSTGPSMMMQKR